MYATRWSPLSVFLGGCVSGAALIGAAFVGLRTGSASESSRGVAETSSARELAAAMPGAGDAEESAEPERVQVHAARDAATSVVARDAVDADPEENAADAGTDVADVLATLEAEYRRRMAPAGSPEPAVSDESERARSVPAEPVRESPETPEPRSDAPERVASTAPASDALSATPPASAAPTPAERAPATPSAPRPELVAVREAPDTRELPEKTLNVGVQQISPEIQQLAAIQHITVVQQVALLQYLQAFPPSQAAPPRAPGRGTAVPRRVPKQPRIVASPPSSISDTDNPWGFDLPPPVLVR